MNAAASMPKAAVLTDAAPLPWVALAAAAVPERVADALEPDALAPDVASATLSPKLKLVVTVPLTVDVMVAVAVVEQVHPAQVVQGALLLHDPLVQPDQVLPGHWPATVPLPPHQAVHGPDVHAPLDPHGPQLFPPKGP